MQIITRKGSFDSGHRVMNESMKCFNCHGHLYSYKLSFSFEKSEEIGYAIDFKEIKRVCCQWIDDILDHGMILNPKDFILIKCINDLKNKLWLMSLNGENEYCNPSVENIAKEVFLAMEVLISNYPLLKIHKVKIWETPNCSTTCTKKSISKYERENWLSVRKKEIKEYSNNKGVLQYDDRKI